MASPKSGTAASKQNGTARSGKVRHVASQGGVKRYGKPIGAEIGGPRDANHAAIQKDQGARKNYGDLINGDPKSQRDALDKMSNDDLNKVADIAFSFKSSNPQVVALRIAARNAQARRGNKIAAGVTQSSGGSKSTPYDRSAQGKINYALSGGEIGPQTQRVVELAAAATKLKNTTAQGSFPIPDVNHLRKAIQAIGRAKPADRPAVARHIISRARALKAAHLISPAIKAHAMGGAPDKKDGGKEKKPNPFGGKGAPAFGAKNLTAVQQQALELTGRWKHGYIPLDAEAMRVKMKGGKGKPWWEGGSPKGSPKSGGGLTNVVKSDGPKSPARGAAVNNMDRLHADTAGKSSTPSPVDRMAKLHRDTAPKQGMNPVTGKVSSNESHVLGTINGRTISGHNLHGAEKGAQTRAAKAGSTNKVSTPKQTKAQQDAAKKRADELNKYTMGPDGKLVKKDTAPAAPAKGKDTTSLHGPTAVKNAKNYVKMHGDAGARKKIAAMEARQKLSTNDKALLGALKAEVGSGKA